MNKKKVVVLSELDHDIAMITMCDEENKNIFTEQFLTELVEAFQTVNESEHYKVVILTGFGNYFMSGAPKEKLLSMHDREIKFTDDGNEGKIAIYSLAMQCKIPVIAAMQGHAIGGGFTFAMYCDVVVMARESVYAPNFMRYGFTPGFGSTYIIPKKVGIALASEMMLTANYYKGIDLEKRGIPFGVYPRNMVLDKAIEIARDMAEKTRISLILLKHQLVKKMLEEVEVTVEEELKMHDITITSNDAEQLINERY